MKNSTAPQVLQTIGAKGGVDLKYVILHCFFFFTAICPALKKKILGKQSLHAGCMVDIGGISSTPCCGVGAFIVYCLISVRLNVPSECVGNASPAGEQRTVPSVTSART